NGCDLWVMIWSLHDTSFSNELEGDESSKDMTPFDVAIQLLFCQQPLLALPDYIFVLIRGSIETDATFLQPLPPRFNEIPHIGCLVYPVLPCFPPNKLLFNSQ
ncbi:hypothetical protein, partial [Coxiella burnetii]|uniref:hypothetical protein n=1 Tax=Coxiella burnetii TaxID=777 RepID=UPI0022312CEA